MRKKVKIIVSNNRSSKHAIDFLNKNGIDFDVIKVGNTIPLKLVHEISSKNLDSIEKILATKSKKFLEIAPYYEKLKFSQMIKIISENPTLLKLPIIMDDKRFLSGFNSDDIRTFMPR